MNISFNDRAASEKITSQRFDQYMHWSSSGEWYSFLLNQIDNTNSTHTGATDLTERLVPAVMDNKRVMGVSDF